MTMTPWGPADQLRERKLRPGPGNDRAAVSRNQRMRLYGAMVAALAEKGYLETTVADVVRISGVSRADYYKYFANKEECFLATLDAIADTVMDNLAGHVATAEDSREGQASVLDRLFKLVVEQPAAARVCLIEIYPAGPAAMARADAATLRLQRLLKQSLDRSPETAGMPPVLLRAILGGIHKIIYTRLRTGNEAELPGLVDQVQQWVLSYRPPPRSLERRIARPPQPVAVPETDGSDEQRLIAATAVLARDRTYEGLTVTEIGKVAATSYTTFYQHFQDKEAAFLATYDLATLQVYQAVWTAYQEETEWPAAVANGLRRFSDFVARETAWSHVGLVEVLAAGPRALERRDLGIASFTDSFLTPGRDRCPELPAITGEAIGGGIFRLWNDHIRRRGAGRVGELVPTVTYFVLAPYIGADAAMTYAKPARGATEH